MKIDIPAIQQVFQAKSYAWDPQINLVGVRTTLQVADVFNDLMCAVWHQEVMPDGLTPAEKQNWLNINLFVGSDLKPLKVDGDFGPKSQYAMEQYLLVAGKMRMKSYIITTDPGTYWLNNPMSKLGTAVLKPGQYVNSHAIGFHQNKPEHRALVQVGKVTVYRDGDKDGVAEASATTETGLFGINIHGANKGMISYNIGKWSAGCQVFQNWFHKEEFLGICDKFRVAKGNKFTYTLIEEKDLAA